MSSPVIEFGILGPLQVRAHGELLPLGGAKRRALLALLLVRANETVSTDWLIDELWDERPPETAANTLQAHVSQLRRVLHGGIGDREPPILVTQAPGYVLRVSPDALDANRFERLLDDADAAHARGGLEEASALFTEALALWRGQPLADVADLGSAQPEIARLEALRRRALEDRIDCELELGRHAEVLAEIEALVALHPLSERLRRQLMLALYRAGRQADALQAYQSARLALTEELGLEPGAELRDLHQAILRHDASVAAPRAVGDIEAPLPSFLTAFVGREQELDEVTALVRRGVRLVTITGLGGMGKTRLAVEAARSLADDFGDGVAYVPLAAIADPALVGATIAQALGESGVASEEVLSARLRSRHLLLLLDNFEQVVDAAPLVSSLLQEAPRLVVLVTSRAALHLSGEHEYPVPSLPAAEAVALFEDRARGVNPHFTLAEAGSAAVEELCARLEGLPLAIELAAARTRLLTPSAMLGRLASRLDLLAEGPRDAPERHRALRTTLDWSYELLTPPQQRLFARLGVFVGGCSLEAAEAVCASNGRSTLEDLSAVVDESLAHLESAPQPRVTMLETVREYALERLDVLGETSETRTRHRDYFVAFAENAHAAAGGPEQSDWFARLELEHDNLRAALSFVRDRGEAEVELRLCVSLWRFWQIHGHLDEGRRALDAALTSNPDGDPVQRARVLNGAGVLAGEQGDFEAAAEFFESSLQVARQLGEHTRIASALANLGNLALFAGDLARARSLYEESIEESVLGGASETELIARENLGLVALDEGDLERAVTLLEESAALAEREQDDRTRASSTRALAAALLESGEHGRARELLAESLTLTRGLGEPHGIASCFDTFAGLAATEGDPEEAAVLFGAADIVRSSIGALRPPDQQPLYEQWLARTLSQLDTTVYATRYEDGRRLELDEACERALRLVRAEPASAE
jgi:predicted ATPase/DNA-binding SARP family transcriptional activator